MDLLKILNMTDSHMNVLIYDSEGYTLGNHYSENWICALIEMKKIFKIKKMEMTKDTLVLTVAERNELTKKLNFVANQWAVSNSLLGRVV